MNSTPQLALAAALLLAPAPALAGSDVAAEWGVDQQHTSNGSLGGVGASEMRGQSFEANVSGRIVSISLRVARSFVHDEPFRIQLFDLDGDGKPTGSARMSEVFAAEEITTEFPVAPTVFDVAAGATITAGERYAITFGPVELDPEFNNYYVNGGFGVAATYEDGAALRSADAGATWVVETNLDWAFRVSVDPATPVAAASWGSLKARFGTAR